MKRILLTVMLLLTIAMVVPNPAWSATYYVYNQWGGTWHDANKTRVDDSLMCWAASAANILDWGDWDTAAYNTETKIFQDIKYYWTNNRGWQSWAWNWWLTGAQPPTKTYAYVNVPGGGDYFPGNSFYSYYATAAGSGEMAAMDALMHKGYGISLVIGTASGASHAITAWGFDYTLVGGKSNYTAVYVTDSDDRVTALKKMGLAYTAVNGWYFTSGYTNWKINGIYGFEKKTGLVSTASAAPIAPALWLFTSGLVLLGGAGLGKSQKLLKYSLLDGGLVAGLYVKSLIFGRATY